MIGSFALVGKAKDQGLSREGQAAAPGGRGGS